MTDAPPPEHPDDHDLLDLAHPYALDAVSDAERASIEHRLRACDPDIRRAFDEIVRQVREAMGALSVLDAQAPPQELEGRILEAIAERGAAGHDPAAVSDADRLSAPAGTDPHERSRDGELGEPAGTGLRQRSGGGEPGEPSRTDRTHLGHPSRTGPAAVEPPSSGAAGADGTDRPAADELAAARTRKRKLVRWVAAAAAVAAVVAIGAAVLGQRTSEQAPARMVTADQVLQQPDARTVTGPVSTGGTLIAHISDELDAVAITFDAVPPPPAGHAHQLWLIGPEGVPRSAGVLTDLPTPGAPYVTEFAASDQLAMTVEPAGGSPGPTTDPIAALPLS
ncbi:anti-sigma factor [Nocardia cyriacigeorgica]|uniref:Regulator of SigK n=1 Tax=Nocardia cyriacigeorgica TaxID=135487 RepID=A0A5R8NGA3_9NOCA|nr:anti-sigma factor [Nocardia cyriacigeorgica]TLF74725.1 anti-sigma factor [Nocardia cyriacigeorgica]